jgi:hypothetical protein
MSGWFDDNKSAAYFCTVQESSSTKVFGELLYSGPFLNTDRLHKVIQVECVKRKQSLCFGCRPRKNPDIVRPEGSKGDWILAENQPVVIEVDVEDEKILKAIVYTTFNKITDFKLHPRGYNIRFLPDKKASSTGLIPAAT